MRQAPTMVILRWLLVCSVLLGCTGSHQPPKAMVPPQNTDQNRIWTGPSPTYPREAMTGHWEGTVVLRVVVGSDCHPTAISLAETSGHEILDQAVLNVANKWTFRQDRVGTNTVKFVFQMQ